MKKPAFAMAVLFIVSGILSAEPSGLPRKLQDLLGGQVLAKLGTSGEATASFHEDGALSLVPGSPFSARIRDNVRAMKPTFGVEVCIARRIGGKTDSPENLLKLYNVLLSVSTLKGTLYYSESRKIMREFFIESFRTDGPHSRNRLPDIFAGAVGPSLSIFGFQHDSSFGENNYKIDYFAGDGVFLMEMINTNQIWYGIIPIVDPGNLRYYIMVVPAGEYVLFYSVICVTGANPFGLMEQRAASFYNRIKALENWFVTRYGG